MKNWANEDVWTFEPTIDGTSAFRGIYKPRETTPSPLSYLVLKVLTAGGEAVVNPDGSDNWAKFLSFLSEWCITSLLTWKNECQCKRYCGIDQINSVAGGCQSIEWDGGLHFTPSQKEANSTAEKC